MPGGGFLAAPEPQEGKSDHMWTVYYSYFLKIVGIVYLSIFLLGYWCKFGLAWHDAGTPWDLTDVKSSAVSEKIQCCWCNLATTMRLHATKLAESLSENVEGSAPLNPVPLSNPPESTEPPRSYAARLLASDRVPYALDTALNLSWSPPLSGWCSRAFFLYALLIWLAVASFGTPRVS